MKNQTTPGKTFRVECAVFDKWVPLFTKVTLEKANKIAEFMRKAEPAGGSVRVVENED